jgi:type IV pilus assembly protein PilB
MRKKIGEVLIEVGLIKQEQLEQALVLQKGGNKRLGKVLIELGYIEETQIADALSRQFSIPLVDCGKYNVSKELLALVPKDVAEKKIIFPIERIDNKLTVVMANPLDWASIDELSFRTGMKILVAVAPETSIVDAIERHYLGDKADSWDLIKDLPNYEDAEFVRKAPEEDEKDENIQSLYNLSEAPPIVKLVTMVLVDAVKSRASDIHIEPHEKHVQVRYRVDGNLRNVLKYPKHIQESVISRIKIIANLDITNRRSPQDGRSTLRYEKRAIDLRISSLPSVYGENIVIRLLDQSTGLVSLGKLGIPEKILTPLLKLASQPQGMILVTGPTGSGKSTTLYALIKQLMTETESIFTIEDPVEYKLQGLTQVGVNEAVGLTFSGALRSILRQDPDIIMVGEIRDRETADIAIRSALTGHLVLSTIHTNDTISTITRLLDIGLDAYLVSSAVTGVLAQRLVRRICPECKIECDQSFAMSGYSLPHLDKSYKGSGCSYCQYTGYRGQVGVYEFVMMDTKLKRLIPRLVPEEELWDAAQSSGTVTLFEDAWAKVRDGITTVEEVLAKIPYRDTEALSGKFADEQTTKILVFNMPESLHGLISRALESEGYMLSFSSDKELVETATRENPDLVLVGEHEGVFDQIKLLRSNIRYAYTPIFLFTDKKQAGNREEERKLGVKEYLSKSLNAARLLSIVNRELKEN